MNKLFKRLGTIALSAVMCFSVIGTALAADTIPRITFDNEYEAQPDLYVQKIVTSAVEGYEAPADTEFTFQLKLDRNDDGELEFADNMKYSVYNQYGQLVSTGYTDNIGQFTLKDGEYAWFEFAGTHDYEIIEETADGFVKVLPAGDSATGTIPSDGTTVTFENVYLPETDDDTTKLEVRKDIEWFDDYEMPDFSDTEFTFEVKIDGDLYSGEPYTVCNSETNEEIDTGRTDSNGRFTMHSNEIAIFDDVQVGVDYYVTEVNTNGWYITGTTNDKGSTVSPVVYATFTNSPVNFIVEKDRSDGITSLDNDYTFVLTSNDNPLSGIQYYVYNSEGNLINEEVQITDENGQFTLKAGERVVFIGLPDIDETGVNIEYKIVETTSGYDVDPANGYTFTESYDTVEDYAFMNTQNTNVTVEKYDENNKNLLSGAEFTLYKMNDSGVYEVYDTAVTSDTEDDTFGKAYFTGLTAGLYKLAETKAPDGYQRNTDEYEFTVPYTMTEEEIEDGNIDVNSEDFKGLWSERDGVYYFYDLTFEVNDEMMLLSLPNASGTPWWPFIVIGACVVAGGVTYFVYQKNKTAKGAVNHA